jgi:hypothetical protein
MTTLPALLQQENITTFQKILVQEPQRINEIDPELKVNAIEILYSKIKPFVDKLEESHEREEQYQWVETDKKILLHWLSLLRQILRLQIEVPPYDILMDFWMLADNLKEEKLKDCLFVYMQQPKIR